MAEQSITCPSCGKKIPLTRALRTEIESVRQGGVREALQKRERELQSDFAARMKAGLESAATEAARAERRKSARN